jgi:hypothetical protein
MLCDVVLPRSTSSWRRVESSELVIRSLTLNMSSHRAEGDLNPVVNFANFYLDIEMFAACGSESDNFLSSLVFHSSPIKTLIPN